MIKALLANSPSAPDGALLLGLEPENMRRLMNDQPIPVNAAVVGLPPLTIILVGGETHAAILAQAEEVGAQLRNVAPLDRPSALAYTTAFETVRALWPEYEPAALLRIASVAVDVAALVDAGQAPRPSFTCPVCNRTSGNLNDVKAGYCGACHAWTGVDAGQLNP